MLHALKNLHLHSIINSIKSYFYAFAKISFVVHNKHLIKNAYMCNKLLLYSFIIFIIMAV